MAFVSTVCSRSHGGGINAVSSSHILSPVLLAGRARLTPGGSCPAVHQQQPAVVRLHRGSRARPQPGHEPRRRAPLHVLRPRLHHELRSHVRHTGCTFPTVTYRIDSFHFIIGYYFLISSSSISPTSSCSFSSLLSSSCFSFSVLLLFPYSSLYSISSISPSFNPSFLYSYFPSSKPLNISSSVPPPSLLPCRGSKNFSSCSADDFEKMILLTGGSCLLNVPRPDEAYSAPYCGNGLVDVGEECDCGSQKVRRRFPSSAEPQCCRTKLLNQCACPAGV